MWLVYLMAVPAGTVIAVTGTLAVIHAWARNYSGALLLFGMAAIMGAFVLYAFAETFRRWCDALLDLVDFFA